MTKNRFDANDRWRCRDSAGEAITTGVATTQHWMVLKKLKAWTRRHSLVCLNHFHQRLKNNWRRWIAKRNLVVYLFLQGGRIAVKITETQKKGFDIQSVLFQIETTLVWNQRQRVNAFQFVGRLVGQSWNCETVLTRSRTYISPDIKQIKMANKLVVKLKAKDQKNGNNGIWDPTSQQTCLWTQ
jgi:uncharacterized protein (DUF736 family)